MTRFAVCLSLLLALPALAQEPEQRIHCDVEDAPLADVVNQIAKQVGASILVDPAVKEAVSVSLRDIGWRETVEVLARMTRCRLSEWPGGILVLDQPGSLTLTGADFDGRRALELAAQAGGRELFVHPAVGGRIPSLDMKELDWLQALHAVASALGAKVYDCNGALVVAPADVPAPPGAGAGEPFTGGDPIDLDVAGVELGDACERIGQAVEQNVLVDPAIDARVSVTLRGIPWRDAVSALARLTGCWVEQRHGIAILRRVPRNTIQAVEVPLPQLVAMLAPYAGKHVVAAAGDYAPVRARLTQVDWLHAIALLAWSQGAELEQGADDLLTLRAGEPQAGGAPRPQDEIATWVDAIESAARAGNMESLQDRIARLLELVRGQAQDPVAPGAPAAGESPALDAAELEYRAEALIRQIVTLAEARDHDALLAKFTELRELLAQSGEAGASAVERSLGSKRWRKRLDDGGEVRLSIQLQLYLQRGNHYLQALGDAETAAKADATKAALDALVAAMREEEREVFHRNADALQLRGDSLHESRRARLALLALPLDLAAIVIPPELSDDRPSALLNGVVVHEGDQVPGAEGVTVVKIQPSVITVRKLDHVAEVPLR